MQTVLTRCARAIALDEAGAVVRDTEVAVADHRTAGVGPISGSLPATSEVDASGKVQLPASFSAHFPRPMAFERG